MTVSVRADRLRDLLPEAGCDALLITSLVHVRYLTGFTGSAGKVLVTDDELLLVTDGRYAEQTVEQTEGAGVAARIEITSTDEREIVVAASTGVEALGLEAEHVSWDRQRELAEDWFPSIDLVPTTGLVEQLRLVKDDGEIDRLAAASEIADEALAEVRHRLAEHPTEREFSLELDTEMRRLGADGPSFETIVGSGPNGAKPHARPTDRRITDGDLVVIDFGALVDGYHSDMTRTIAIGAISATQQRMLDVVLEAQQAGVDAVAEGVEARTVDEVCRTIIEDAGWGDAFLHGTGHGIGLQIHEAPRVGTTSDATLTARNVVTVEPGVYLPEHGGVRIEDSLVVEADGRRRLTDAPKHTTI